MSPTRVAVVLYSYGSQWDCLSFDFRCFQTQCRLNAAGVEYDIEANDNPATSPNGRLPFMYIPSEESFFTDSQLDDKYRPVVSKSNLSPTESSDTIALAAWVDSKLAPALIFHLWCEPSNYPETRAVYTARLPWPLNLIIGQRIKSAFLDQFGSGGVVNRDQVYDDAHEVMAALNDRLGSERRFFFGDKPTEVDCVLYPYLALIRRAPMPTRTLKDLLLLNLNLVRYVDTLDTVFCGKQ